MQQKLNYRQIGNYHVPVMHLTQLVALALGVEIRKLGFGAHAISFQNFIEKFNLIQPQREVANG
jgi:heterodisulfide reductase subunit B